MALERIILFAALRPGLLPRGKNVSLARLLDDHCYGFDFAVSSAFISTTICRQARQVGVFRLRASALAANGKVKQDAAGLVEYFGEIRAQSLPAQGRQRQ